MKNICFLIDNMSHTGGTERVTSMIANELVNNQCNVFLLSVSECEKTFFDIDQSIQTFSLFSEKVSMKKIFINAFSTILKIRKFALLNKIDTFIVVDSIYCLFTVPALSRLKIKHICWEHFNFKVNLGTILRKVARRLAAKYCSIVVTLTKRDKQLWENGLDIINAKIIPIANPSPYEKIEHNPSIEFKTVLAVGRLTNQKGFDLLLEAWADFCKNDSDWLLRIIGSGKDEALLKLKAENLQITNRVEFLQTTKNIKYFYERCSFFCMSSRFEGLPMVLLEAQSYGLPIISFDCDTGPDELIEDNVNGYLVEPLNTHQLALALDKAINLSKVEYKRVSNCARMNSENYSIKFIIKQWVDII